MYKEAKNDSVGGLCDKEISLKHWFSNHCQYWKAKLQGNCMCTNIDDSK